LFNLEKTEILNFINEQKKHYRKDFSALDENQCVARVIQQYVEAIKLKLSNIEFSTIVLFRAICELRYAGYLDLGCDVHCPRSS
jgi:hypothetical protein